MSEVRDKETVWKDLLTFDTEKAVEFFYPDIHADIDWTHDPISLEQEFRKNAPDMIAGKRLVDKLLLLIQRETGERRYLHLKIQIICRLDAYDLTIDERQRWLAYYDWLLYLPKVYTARLWDLINATRKEKPMPRVSYLEEYLTEKGMEKGMEKGQRVGLLKAIRLGLKLKFQDAGLGLMPQIDAVSDSAVLNAIYAAIDTDSTLDDICKLIPAHTNGRA